MNQRAVSERGTAPVEVLLIGLVLLVPLLWLLGTLSEAHRGALATTAAARGAGLEIARAREPRTALARVRSTVAQALESHGLEARSARLHISTGARLERGSHVVVEVGYPVRVLRVPFLGVVAGPEIWVSARYVARVEPYGSRR